MNINWKRAVVPALSASLGVAIAGACLAFSAALDQLLRIAFYRSVLVLTVVVTAGTVALLRRGDSGSAARAWVARVTARLRRLETAGAATWSDAASLSHSTPPARGPIPGRTLASLDKVRYVAWIDAAGPDGVCPPPIVAPVAREARAAETTSFRTAGSGGHK